MQEFEPFALSATHQTTSLYADSDEPTLSIEDEAPLVYRGVMAPPSLSYGAHGTGHASTFEPLQNFGTGFADFHDQGHELDNQGFGSLNTFDSQDALDNFNGFQGFNDFDKLDLSHYHDDHTPIAETALFNMPDVHVNNPVPQEHFPVPQMSSVLGERPLEQSRFIVQQPLAQAIHSVQSYLANRSIDFQWDPAQYLARCEAMSTGCAFHIRVMQDANTHVVEFQRRRGCVMAFNQIVAQLRAVCCDGSSPVDLSQWDGCGMLDSDVDMASLGALAPPSFATWGAQSAHDEPSMESSDDEQEEAPSTRKLESSAILSLLSLLIAKGIDLQSDAAQKLAQLSSCPSTAADLWAHQQGQVLRCVEALCGLGAVGVMKTDACFDALSCSDLDVQRGRLVRNALAVLANIAASTAKARRDMVDSPLLATLGELLDKAHPAQHADLRRQSGRLLSLLSASHGASLSSMLPLLHRNITTTDPQLNSHLQTCVDNVMTAQQQGSA